MSSTVRALEPLLQSQERLDRLIQAAFRRFGPRLVDLSYANPHDGPTPEVLDVLRRVSGERTGLSLQYTPYGGRTMTRRAVAARLTHEYGLPFHDRDVVMTTGAMSALNVVCRALFGPEDEVIVLTPAWHDYPLYLRNLNIPIRFVPLRPDKHLDLDAIAGAVTARTRGLLFSQPCCPTGVLYSRDEIADLSTMLTGAEARFDSAIYMVSDEVHRHMVWSGDRFYSPLRSYPRSLSIYSFGKALSLQGQRIGYAAVSPAMPENAEVRTALERCVRLMGFSTPTSLMQHVVAELLDYQPSLGDLADRQALVRRTLSGYGYDVCDGQASFYVYVKSPMADDFACAERLAARGVLVAPSTLFHDPGYIRLSLTERLPAIERALPAFEQILSTDLHAGHTQPTTCSNLC
jgi:aspartate aminotransferase